MKFQTFKLSPNPDFGPQLDPQAVVLESIRSNLLKYTQNIYLMKLHFKKTLMILYKATHVHALYSLVGFAVDQQRRARSQRPRGFPSLFFFKSGRGGPGSPTLRGLPGPTVDARARARALSTRTFRIC